MLHHKKNKMGEIEIGSYVKYLRSDSKVYPESLYRIEDIIFLDSPVIKNIIVLSNLVLEFSKVFLIVTETRLYDRYLEEDPPYSYYIFSCQPSLNELLKPNTPIELSSLSSVVLRTQSLDKRGNDLSSLDSYGLLVATTEPLDGKETENLNDEFMKRIDPKLIDLLGKIYKYKYYADTSVSGEFTLTHKILYYMTINFPEINSLYFRYLPVELFRDIYDRVEFCDGDFDECENFYNPGIIGHLDNSIKLGNLELAEMIRLKMASTSVGTEFLNIMGPDGDWDGESIDISPNLTREKYFESIKYAIDKNIVASYKYFDLYEDDVVEFFEENGYDWYDYNGGPMDPVLNLIYLEDENSIIDGIIQIMKHHDYMGIDDDEMKSYMKFFREGSVERGYNNVVDYIDSLDSISYERSLSKSAMKR